MLQRVDVALTRSTAAGPVDDHTQVVLGAHKLRNDTSVHVIKMAAKSTKVSFSSDPHLIATCIIFCRKSVRNYFKVLNRLVVLELFVLF